MAERIGITLKVGFQDRKGRRPTSSPSTSSSSDDDDEDTSEADDDTEVVSDMGWYMPEENVLPPWPMGLQDDDSRLDPMLRILRDGAAMERSMRERNRLQEGSQEVEQTPAQADADRLETELTVMAAAMTQSLE